LAFNFILPYNYLFDGTFLYLCREGSARGFGIRKSNSSLGSDSWVDDPITRHIIGLYINKEWDDDKNLLWPLILHIKGPYSILVLPLVEPRHVKAYEKLCKTPDCGSSLGLDDSLSSLLLDLPAITGYAKLLYLQMAITFRSYSFRLISCHSYCNFFLNWMITLCFIG
jgi:hypothetical protein